MNIANCHSGRDIEWDEPRSFGSDFVQESISTESEIKEHPRWQECVDALLKIYSDPGQIDNAGIAIPNLSSLQAALRWVIYLRRRFPWSPPTLVIPEPSGGIIVERRIVLGRGEVFICEFIFYNDGECERIDIHRDKVVDIYPVPDTPPH